MGGRVSGDPAALITGNIVCNGAGTSSTYLADGGSINGRVKPKKCEQ